MKEAQSNTQSSPWRYSIGAAIATALGIGMYSLTASIAHTFATKPPTANSIFALKISLAVRTLVVGVSTLATGLFALAAFGLIALTIQTIFTKSNQTTAPLDRDNTPSSEKPNI